MPSPGDRPDPRLEIPEILRTPVRQSNMDPVTGDQRTGLPTQSRVDITGMGKAWARGFDFTFTVIAGVGLGWLADYLLGSSPVGLLIGLALGFASGLVRMIRTANRLSRGSDARKAARK